MKNVGVGTTSWWLIRGGFNSTKTLSIEIFRPRYNSYQDKMKNSRSNWNRSLAKSIKYLNFSPNLPWFTQKLKDSIIFLNLKMKIFQHWKVDTEMLRRKVWRIEGEMMSCKVQCTENWRISHQCLSKELVSWMSKMIIFVRNWENLLMKIGRLETMRTS